MDVHTAKERLGELSVLRTGNLVTCTNKSGTVERVH